MPKAWVHRALIGVAVAIVAGSCSTSTSPRQGSSIQILAGGGEQDTIGATLPQALVIRVALPIGGTNAGQAVQFSTIQPSAPSGAIAYVSSVTSPGEALAVVDSTDRTGMASVQIIFGTVTGVARVQITVPALKYIDTASFTVLPGQADTIAITPPDTLLAVGKQVTLHSASFDRAGNSRPSDVVTYKVRYGGVSLSGSVVTTTAPGLASVVAATGGASDSALISVVPSGTLAAISDTGGVIMFNLDGSGFQAVTRIPATDVKWAPSGASVVFICPEPYNVLPICTSDLHGNVDTLDLATETTNAWPFYSRDGTWIYYSHIGGPGGILKREHPDGSMADSLNSQLPADDYWPSPSPDGTKLAYVDLLSGNLRIMTIATGAVVDLGIIAHSPAWSPNSNQIAYLASDGGTGSLAVVNSDGSGQRALGTVGSQYYFDLDWSPDGQWIVWREQATAKIDVINVATNRVMPLAFTGFVGSPAWQPGSGTGGSAAVLRPASGVSRAVPRARRVVGR